jgi:hypothetical protein
MAEVHDCFTPTELVIYEDLGFAERGQGWREALAGTFDLDGELPTSEREALRIHLASCGRCRARRASLGRSIERLASLPAIQVSHGFEGRLLTRLAVPPRRHRFAWAGRAAAWGLAAAAAAGVSVWVSGPRRAASRDPGALTDLVLAERLDLFENYDAVAVAGVVQTPEDLAVVAELDRLDLGGRP